MLIEKIVSAQQNNESAKLDLVQTFDPLLRKYARLLQGGEDSYQELVLFFLDLLNKINLKKLRDHNDATIVRYIATSTRNHYIRLSQKGRSLSDHEVELSDTMQFTAAEDAFGESTAGILDCLSEFERLVVVSVILEGYSAAEIAKRKHCSRQHINQVKQRALAKLKAQFQ